MKLTVTFLLLGLLVLAKTETTRFDNYKVFRVTPRSEEELQLLKSLAETDLSYTFWNQPSQLDKPVDIMVAPHLQTNYKDIVALKNLDSEVLIENVQKLIDEERPEVRKGERSVDWTDYNTLSEIYAWLQSLADAYPNTVTLLNIGKTYEGRDILGVKVSFSAANANRSFFIEGGIHAREWISPATVTFILNDILTTTNTTLKTLYESFDYYVFPVFNPDGYEFTFTTNRLWRKTRVPYSGGCYGSDPNRNWDYQWMTGGASTLPCSETYAGPRAFSEPSTKAASDYISTISDKLFGYLAFHSYSQLMLLPYGHTQEHLDNYDEVYAIGQKAVASLASKYGTSYIVRNVAETSSLATGGSMDWVKGTHGTRVVITYELRDKGQHGFLLPASQIIPTAEETLDSVITILNESLKLS